MPRTARRAISFENHKNLLAAVASPITEGKLAIPQPHTNYMKNSFSYSGAVLLKSLPIELWQVDSLSVFRAGCERFYLEFLHTAIM